MKLGSTLLPLFILSAALWVPLLLLPATARADAPAVDQITVTDVTTRSFSVVWAASEGSTASLEVFSDELGTVAAGDAVVVAHPIGSGSAAIRAAAEDRGVMKARVTGLAADTHYYFRTLTTSKSTGDTTRRPDAGPLLPVTTASSTLRTIADAQGVFAFANDLIVEPCLEPDGTAPAEGALLIAWIEGARYPVTAFAGDGIGLPDAMVDLNNVFGADSGANVDLTGGPGITLEVLRGPLDESVVVHTMPDDASLAEAKPAAPGLAAGWNWVALPIEPIPSHTQTVLSPINDALISAWSWDPGSGNWLLYDPTAAPGENDFVEMEARRAYWLNLAVPTSLVVNGAPSATPKPLDAGWNAVGFDSRVPRAIEEALDPISSAVRSAWGYDAHHGRWLRFERDAEAYLNDLERIEPGRGYWLMLEQQAELP